MKKHLLKYFLIVLALHASTGLLWANTIAVGTIKNEALEALDSINEETSIEAATNVLSDSMRLEMVICSTINIEEVDQQINRCIYWTFSALVFVFGLFLCVAKLYINGRKVKQRMRKYFKDLWILFVGSVQINWLGYFATLLIGGGVSAAIIIWLCNSSTTNAHSAWERLGERLDTHPLLVGIMATIWGLLLVFIILKPRLVIDDKLFLYANTHKLKVRVRNYGLFPVHNVIVKMHWCIQKDGVLKTTEMVMYKEGSIIMESVFTKKGNKSYAFHTKNEYINWKEKEGKSYDSIRCQVQATHAVSGITQTYERKFTKEDFDKLGNTPKVRSQEQTNIVCGEIK